MRSADDRKLTYSCCYALARININRMKIFFDTEFTGLHQGTGVYTNIKNIMGLNQEWKITEQEQRTKFVRLYNGLNAVLNGR